MNTQPFHGIQAATVNIDVSSSSQAVSLGITARGYRQVRIVNNGSATAWVTFGDSTVTASLTSAMPVGPGAHEVLTVPNGTTHVAAIAAAATGKIYFTPGSGI